LTFRRNPHWETNFKLALLVLVVVAVPNQAVAQADYSSFRAGVSADTKAAEPADLHAAKIDPVKEAAIRKLLEVQGIKDGFGSLAAQIVANAGPQVSVNFPPGKYREKLIKLFLARFEKKLRDDELLNFSVGVYDRHFNKSEIDGLVSFYGTPLGKKDISVRKELSAEIDSDAEKLGFRAWKEAVTEVLDENPDLRRELHAARSAEPKR